MWIGPSDEKRDQELFDEMVEKGGSFHDVVMPLLERREINRCDVRLIIMKGLERVQFDCDRLPALFHIAPKRFRDYVDKRDVMPPLFQAA